MDFDPGHKRRRSSTEDAVRGARPHAEQPAAARRRPKPLHARPRQLQRRRAPLLVPPPPVRRPPAAVLGHAGGRGVDGGLRARRRGPQVRYATLPPHVRQRAGPAERALLLSRVAHVGSSGDPAGVVAAQAAANPDVAVLRAAATADVARRVDGGGEAEAVHGAVDVAEAQSRRFRCVSIEEVAATMIRSSCSSNLDRRYFIPTIKLRFMHFSKNYPHF